jgi:hypothetical protein
MERKAASSYKMSATINKLVEFWSTILQKPEKSLEHFVCETYKNLNFEKPTYKKFHQCISNVCGTILTTIYWGILSFVTKNSMLLWFVHQLSTRRKSVYQSSFIGIHNFQFTAWWTKHIVNANTNISQYHSHQEMELTQQKPCHLYRHLKM